MVWEERECERECEREEGILLRVGAADVGAGWANLVALSVCVSAMFYEIESE